MRSRPCFLNSSERGFTLPELITASALGLVITALALSSTMSMRNVFGRDTARTRLNQSLRGGLDVLSIDVREAGEDLPSTFPAVEIVNGTGSGSDTLIVRRNLLSEVLSLCQQIDAGTTTPQLYYAVSGSVAGCVLSGQDHNYNSWKSYRVGNGGTVKAYLYDSVAKRGEFFDYGSETRSYTSYQIVRTNSGAWAYTYPTGSSAIYLLEEWKFSMHEDMLRVTADNDEANAFNVAFGITDFQVKALMQDGSTKLAFANTDSWALIKVLEVELTGSDHYAGKQMSRTVLGRLAPRNILSH